MEGRTPAVQARFDDLTPGAERSFRLVHPLGVIEARRPREVMPALGAVETEAARGRWVGGFVSYEAAPGVDPALAIREPSPDGPFSDLPLVWFGVFADRRDDPLPEPEDGPASTLRWAPSVHRASYDAAIARIQARIRAGDTYQVNHTLRLRSAFRGDDLALYRDLCFAQRGGHAAYIATDRFRVLSASPELFFRIDGDRVTTRPMKGTASRGRWPREDEEAAARLAASAKDRAENAMIVDLIRNDLGRISVPGTVEVERMFDVERYETVWQLTSTVSSRLRPGTGVADVFRALFPSGSVTGAPKVATMRIIADLEDSPRGVYCGAVGYLAPVGADAPRVSFNVAIRTVVLDTRSRTAEYGVGGGITAGSSAALEFDEALAKARVLTVRRPRFALLETLRLDPDGAFRHLPEHLARLAGSARYFGFRFDRDAAVAALGASAVDAGAPTRVRLTLDRDGALQVERDPSPPEAGGPIRVALDDDPVDPDDVWLFHKTTRREPYERRRRRRPDVDDVLLVNSRGEVTETTIANLAVRLESGWVTPPLDCGLLAGTYRERLVRDGRLTERPVTAAELRGAREMALVSSVRGWRAAVLVP
jgi:para-aminobenzoate synthetase/4-amino-4-deoxychorismate lyase